MGTRNSSLGRALRYAVPPLHHSRGARRHAAHILSVAALTLLTLLGCATGPRASGGADGGADTPTFAPPEGKTLMFIGQHLPYIGGLEGYTEGYVDEVGLVPAGVTLYTSITTLQGLRELDNWGSGDICAECIMEDDTFDNSILHLSIWMAEGNEHGVAAGDFDDKIASLAEWLKEQDRPVFLRPGYEFDGPWNDYDPEAYREAFRRIHDRLHAAGARNATYVFHASEADIFQAAFDAYYPGDDYVDWLGYSYFGRSFGGEGRSAVMLQEARERGKPVFIGESSPRRIYLGRADPEYHWTEGWFAAYFEHIEQNGDVVKAVSYIADYWDENPMWNGWGDARLHLQDEILTRWQDEMAEPRYLHAYPGLFDDIGYSSSSE